MTVNMNSSGISDLVQIISEQGMAGLGSAFQVLLNQAMLMERDRYLGAASYERTKTRTGYANGFKPKELKTRIGTLDLSIPQVRDGEFYPTFLELLTGV